MFAYGQTGCGKTHTMIGNIEDESMKGIMPKSFTHIFSAINSGNKAGIQFLIRCSFIEIYNEEIRDLLSKVIYYFYHIFRSRCQQSEEKAGNS